MPRGENRLPVFLAASLLLTLPLLSGCGQTGPLYFPEHIQAKIDEEERIEAEEMERRREEAEAAKEAASEQATAPSE